MFNQYGELVTGTGEEKSAEAIQRIQFLGACETHSVDQYIRLHPEDNRGYII